MHRFVLLLATTVTAAASAQPVRRSQLPLSHPLIGSWRIDLPDVDCYELYDLHANGTTRVTSGDQDIETEFELSSKPNGKGFYKWVDRVTKQNGKPDCMGDMIEDGQVSTNYILLLPSGTKFMLCAEEDPKTCIGPFVRQPGI